MSTFSPTLHPTGGEGEQQQEEAAQQESQQQEEQPAQQDEQPSEQPADKQDEQQEERPKTQGSHFVTRGQPTRIWDIYSLSVLSMGMVFQQLSFYKFFKKCMNFILWFILSMIF